MSIAPVATALSTFTTAAMTDVVTLRGLSKVFYTEDVESHAVREVSLDIAPGEFVAITGPSGCGKTTLLSLIGLLDDATAGQYVLAGTDVTAMSRRERARVRNRQIGIIFQGFNLLGDMTVAENVQLPLTFRGMPLSEREARVESALNRVGMLHRAYHYPNQLSGGQQQRVAVARAVAGAPALLLADEPTGNLDTASGAAVMELLTELHAAGSTVCMVTHDPGYAMLAQRQVSMRDGAVHVVENTSA